jgi:trehalose/maltose hydrolase-like predicted phosphorylase
MAARLDLDDLTQATAGGLHLATMGSVWQALAFGFAGLRPGVDTLRLDPVAPDGWRALDIRVGFRGSRVRVRIEPDAVDVRADREAKIAFRDEAPVSVGPGGHRWRLDAGSERRQP